MRLAQQNVDNTIGILWNHKVGFCRAIINAKPLLPWPSSFPDSQTRVQLCIFNSVITGQGKNYTFESRKRFKYKLNRLLI